MNSYFSLIPMSMKNEPLLHRISPWVYDLQRAPGWVVRNLNVVMNLNFDAMHRDLAAIQLAVEQFQQDL